MSDVIVVGAGPVGLFLACELRLAGVDVTVLEQRIERSPYTKSMAMHARTIELLALRGLAGPVLEHGVRLPTWHFGFLEQRIDFTGLDSPYPFVLSFPQGRTEALLEERAVAMGARVERGVRVTGLIQDQDSVRVKTGRDEWQAGWVVGADGAASVVRQAVGVDFAGIDARFFAYLGDVHADRPPAPGFNVVNENGSMMVAPMPGGIFRIAGYDPEHQEPGRREITLDELRDICVRIAGDDFGIRDPQWLSRFGNTTRVAATYRHGRVLLAGDAAHMHYPAGGVGLNLGVQDAMNLGWKLAAVIQGRAADALLDTYDAERRPWGEDVARHTMAQTALITATTPEGLALRGLLNGLIGGIPEITKTIARRLAALDVRYPGSHPLTGTRVAELGDHLRGGHAVLVNRPDRPRPRAKAAAALMGIHHAEAEFEGIVRPDGYVWWAADEPGDDAMIEALEGLGVTFGDH